MSGDIRCLLGETPSQKITPSRVADLAVVFVERLQAAGYSMYDGLDIELFSGGVRFRSGPFHFYALRDRSEQADSRLGMLENAGLTPLVRDTEGTFHIGLYHDEIGAFQPQGVILNDLQH